MFLRNLWYAVAWDHEIKHAPFARTVCGGPIVFYRQTSGSIFAFEDCCPHRLLPLSKGYQDRGLTFRIRDAQAAVFAENTDILEAQQESILRRPERKLLDLKIDSGGVYAPNYRTRTGKVRARGGGTLRVCPSYEGDGIPHHYDS
jgi:phenylpropionate dioxygenase-like ring-hydroxylating dioxygenase large terminal subunit